MTPDQAKAKLRQQGLTAKKWAEDNGFEAHTVTAVLNNNNKGRYGQAHEVAVALGIKQEATNV